MESVVFNPTVKEGKVDKFEIQKWHNFYFISYLLEANILCVFMEALTADVQTVLSDDSMSVRAGTARKKYKIIFIKKF